MSRIALIFSLTSVILAGLLLLKLTKEEELPPVQIVKADISLPIHREQIPALLIRRNVKDSISIPMRISKIGLNVKVTGNIASTVMDITFYNDLDRVLDGEFCFPLGEGQTVNYFAMETEKGL